MEEQFFDSAEGSIVVVPVPCLRDNYAYLVHLRDRRECFVVDPSEALPVQEEVRRRGLKLIAILNTHHHWDHVGGNEELAAEGMSVYAHQSDAQRVPNVTSLLEHEQSFAVGGVTLRALHIPGHTLGAVAYVSENFCFTGDTLFCGGCGRLFEGTPEQMHRSLNHTLGELSDETIAFTGHEYTEANLRFANRLEPGNAELKRRLEEVSAARRQGAYRASAPLALERRTNPFLRCDQPEIRAHAGLKPTASDQEVFRVIRKMKDAA